MRFLVTAPNYANNSAGTRVMHRLCHFLNETGHSAKMACTIVNPEWNTPMVQADDLFDVVIYPEVVRGNPLNALRVVRYVLNIPGKLGGMTEYEENEMVWYYTKDLKYHAQKAASGREVYHMCLPVIERELFNTEGCSDRPTDAVYIGKGTEEYAVTPHPANAVEITKKWPDRRGALADLLKSTHTLYSYDNYTMLLYEAHLCGCKVLTIDNNREWVEYHPPYKLATDELAMVRDFTAKVEAYYEGKS